MISEARLAELASLPVHDPDRSIVLELIQEVRRLRELVGEAMEALGVLSGTYYEKYGGLESFNREHLELCIVSDAKLACEALARLRAAQGENV